ncbi:hypothetical protein [Shewanella sp. YLB-07]|nr:hypothetical protein [Shewanella sp. YLB-07]
MTEIQTLSQIEFTIVEQLQFPLGNGEEAMFKGCRSIGLGVSNVDQPQV